MDLTELIQERARKGKLNSLSLIAGSTGPTGHPSTLIFKAHCRTPEGVLSTGDDVDPVKALVIALEGRNAGVNRTKKQSTARIEEEEAAEMDFG